MRHFLTDEQVIAALGLTSRKALTEHLASGALKPAAATGGAFLYAFEDVERLRAEIEFFCKPGPKAAQRP